MSRSFSRFTVPFVYICFSLLGCQKPADQQATPSSNNAAPAPADSQSAANQAANTPAQAPAPQPIVVPRGTAIEVVLNQSLSSKNSSEGQSFSATVVDPVVVNGQEVIPKGTHARGTVTSAKTRGSLQGRI
jgi:hypothetical protein